MFACAELTNGYPTTTSTASEKRHLFLTYQGLLRVLFVTRDSKTNKFKRERDRQYVAIAFGVESLKTTLLNKDRGYRRNDDYKAFACIEAINHRHKTTSTASAKKY